MKLLQTLLCITLMIPAGFGIAQEKSDDGQVELPLGTYNNLVDSSKQPIKIPLPPPAFYALGTAEMTVNVAGVEPRATAEIIVQLQIKVLENGWTAIPVLAAGTPISAASIGGAPVQRLLVDGPVDLRSDQFVVERSVAARCTFYSIMKIGHYLIQRQLVSHLHPIPMDRHVFLRPTTVLTQSEHCTQMFRRDVNRG